MAYKKCIIEMYSFFVNDTTLPSDNLLRFRKIFWRIYKKIIATDINRDDINDINKEAAKISTLSLDKIANNYRLIAGEEMLPYNQKKKFKKMIE